MRLIIGLGNPGNEYENTRHNVGFIMIDAIAQHCGIQFNKKKFEGSYGEGIYHNEKVILLKPLRYMNLSGEVVRKFVDFYHIEVSNILVISDDLDLPFGVIRLKERGSSGGHNGLKNIECHLKTQEYHRLKIGIAKHSEIDIKDYVLGHFNHEEKQIIEHLKPTIVQLFSDSFEKDYDNLMNQYNKKQK